MKTIKFVVFAIFASVVFNACNVEDSGEDCTCPAPEKWYTEILEVKATDWDPIGPKDEIGSYYEYVFNGFPYVDGIINVYMFINYGTSAEIQVPLPYTEYGVDILEDDREKDYSIQYSYDIAKDGTIAFKIYISDYLTSFIPLYTEYFRVAIIY
jgi:hypothetical protein